MGLLDEAIKEHLDLKRRRGADPAEVERDEREALGPVRRGPSSPSADVGDEPSAESGFAYDHEEEAEWRGDRLEPADEPESSRGVSGHDLESDFGDSDLDHEPEPAPAHRPSRLARIFGRTDPEPEVDEAIASHPPPRTGDADDRFDEPDPHPAAPPRAAGAQVGDETTEYKVEPAREGEKPPEGEDVLEETPEFLQDTPDHDRLWFEQRPPKDFDFNG